MSRLSTAWISENVPFKAAHIYAAPLHMVLTSMLQEIAKGSEAPCRTGTMQDAGYGLRRKHLFHALR